MKGQVIRCARMPVAVPLEAILEEVRALPAHWKAHLNKADYEGAWTVLSLRAPGGNPDHIAGDALSDLPYEDTPLMAHAPSIKELLDSLPFSATSVRLLRLGTGSFIREHRDADLSFEQGEARLHFPIVTHPEISFIVDGERLQMQEGECWYINANLPHSVSNPGPSDRIHLVVDGAVTEGLRALFDQADRSYSILNESANEAESLAIIRELRLQNTAVSMRLAEEMEQQLLSVQATATSDEESPSDALRDWIPARLVHQEGDWLCEWLFAEKIAFSDPFFQETLDRAGFLPANRHPFRSATDLSVLFKWSRDNGSVAANAFIFHVSRCGSTLVTQLLGLDPAHIVVPEAPLLDDILRLPFREKQPATDLSIIKEAFTGALGWYGRAKNGNETSMFVKLDSWHICFYQQLREWFPNTPFFLLYRAPEEVLQSHHRRRGMQSVPNIIEPSILWGKAVPPSYPDLDGYMAGILSVYMQKFLDAAASDPHAYLFNYSEGMIPFAEKIAAVTGATLTSEAKTQMEERARFHGKYPEEPFKEESGMGISPELLAPLNNLYNRLEAMRRR